jgi:hypothetical protein
MRSWLGVILVCLTVPYAIGQTPSSKYQPGTIVAVAARQKPGQPDSDVTQYDVTVRVGNTKYAVLFTPPSGSNTVKYLVGDQLLVLVGSKTLTFNSPVSGKTEVPILSRETLPAAKLDASNVCGQYSNLKMQNLSEKLALTDAQQAQIRPISQQEAGEVGEICFNPALSREDKLSRYEQIVQASDAKMKPLLSASQVQKLEDLRKGQKQQLKQIIAQQSAKQN